MSHQASLAELSHVAAGLTRERGRTILGIAGVPGAGKSTLAEGLARELRSLINHPVYVLPLDGFHLSSRELQRLGISAKKGAPETFADDAFSLKVKELASGASLTWPSYSRISHDIEPDAIRIAEETCFTVVEGNYLLLPGGAWEAAHRFFVETWFVEADETAALERLMARQERAGLCQEDAREHVMNVDVPNISLVLKSRTRADRFVSLSPNDPALSGLIDPATGHPFQFQIA